MSALPHSLISAPLSFYIPYSLIFRRVNALGVRSVDDGFTRGGGHWRFALGTANRDQGSARGFDQPVTLADLLRRLFGTPPQSVEDIDQTNVARLAAQWTFQTGLAGHKFEATPIVIDGMLYVTGPMNHAWAIDGKSGRQMWRYQRRLPPLGDLRVCCGMVNRGFAVHGERLYMTTLDAHLIALDRRTGAVLWDIELAEHTEGYASTGAPLIVNDKVIVGVAGGEFAIRGFLDAYDPHDGNRLWRFWTVPVPGERGAETWPAEVWQRGGGPTWLTGTYDPESNVLYWGTGNPNPDLYGADRKGDNLYTNALVALDADTGKATAGSVHRDMARPRSLILP
ncbi:MAG: PQQ-binding-like beta-propeller repeat protein [Vicinamibacterales bacterium]